MIQSQNKSLFLAGDNQKHITENVFNVLGNYGFLRNEKGILTLESVQKFFEIIDQPRFAAMRKVNLLYFCDQHGNQKLEHQPVITLMKKNSRTGEVEGHAAVLESYERNRDSLILSTIDSASTSGETSVTCPITVINGQQKLDIGHIVDQLCLGSDKCYVFYFS